MADYGNYTTYHFDDVDEMSDYESTGAPPPPPPEDDYARNSNKNSSKAVDEVPKDLEHGRHSEYDKLNNTINTTHDVYDDDGEDGSVEIPPTKVVEDMMRREQEAQTNKGGRKVVFVSAMLCILLSLAIILAAGYGTGAFDSSTTTMESSAFTADGYTPNEIPGETAQPEADEPVEEETFDERPNEEPLATEDTSSRGQAMKDYLSTVAVGGADSFSDLASPESLALQWLILEDPLQLDATKEEDQFQITQRYALVTLWYNSDFTWANETNWLQGSECTWHGVYCISLAGEFPTGNASAITRSGATGVQVVSGINLEGNNVQGNIPADISLLSFVTSLNLADNLIEGSLPASIAQMTVLEELYLDRNMLTQDLSNYDFSPLATTLTLLDISSNKFSGSLPSSLWKLTKLELLVMDMNAFTGSLSDDISSLTSLTRLTAGGNQLSGSLPTTISALPNLEVVWLFKNKFTGPLPATWADSLIVLDLYDNEMTGAIPSKISALPNLQQMVLGANLFTGPIPDEIGQYMLQLTVLNLEANNLTGRAMPSSLSNLGNLTVLRLGNNPGMEPDFLAEYVSTRWPSLEELRLPGLKLRGNLNNVDWRNLRNLRILDLSNNFLQNFPVEISFCEDLEELNLSDNLELGGNLPDNMDALQNLKHLLLANAGLAGNLTASLGSLPNLEYLDLTNNTFMGTLPNLGGLVSAHELKFGTNFFTGSIPASVGELQQLEVLDLSVNFLDGELPTTLGNVKSLVSLSLGDNANEEPFSGLSGALPSDLAKLVNLVRLELFSNRFTGVLPPEWGALDKLELLDVEYNPLTGTIPSEFSGMTSLTEFYGSNTDLEGSVPSGVCSLAPKTFVVDCDVQCSCCSACEDGAASEVDGADAEVVDEEAEAEGAGRR